MGAGAIDANQFEGGDMTKKDHKSGKYTGYELRDGKYFVAPMYVEQLQSLKEESMAVEDLLRSVSGFATKQFAALRKRQHEIWTRMSDDLGVDFIAAEATYDFNECSITIPVKEEEMAPEATP